MRPKDYFVFLCFQPGFITPDIAAQHNRRPSKFLSTSWVFHADRYATCCSARYRPFLFLPLARFLDLIVQRRNNLLHD
jgi:hypothetical protein